MTKRTARKRLREETGSALLASLMLTVLITGAGLAAMTTSSVAMNKSKNLVNAKQATYMAEAALHHANMYLHQNIANWASYATTSTQTLIGSTSFAGVGSYTVTVKAAGATGGVQSALLLTATGMGLNNATKSISTVVAIESGNLQKNAFITGQSLVVSGSPQFNGASGGIHANGNLTISGSPQITTNAQASGTYTVTGSPAAVFSGGNQPYQTINSLTVWQLSGSYDYYFYYCYNSVDSTYHGCVRDRNWNLLADAANDQPLNINGNTCWEYKSYSYSGGWYWDSFLWTWVYTPITYKPFKWKATCTPPNGTYYAIGDVVLEGDIGTSANPWITTILAYGSIKVESYNLVVRSPTSADGSLYKTQTQNLLFVANMDI
ncbi:MAG: pilus assembly PilX N-terminal domain-containing protein, partial [Nitrospirales bacterium]|nr:pilus assembly PilX N-terminal domain-containing protein [Nitrospirales bacterium]